MYDEYNRRLSIVDILSVMESLVDTGTKRHILGGVLLSVSFLFGGLAITTMTIKDEEDENDED